jgi:DNA-binding PadR family transcriptional regulator
MTRDLTANSYAVLAVLDALGGGSSYDLKGAAQSKLSSFWTLSHATAYEEPLRLERLGYLRSRAEDSGRRRRNFELTQSGRAVLREWLESPAVEPTRLYDEAWLKAFAKGDEAGMQERVDACGHLLGIALEAALRGQRAERK